MCVEIQLSTCAWKYPISRWIICLNLMNFVFMQLIASVTGLHCWRYFQDLWDACRIVPIFIFLRLWLRAQVWLRLRIGFVTSGASSGRPKRPRQQAWVVEAQGTLQPVAGLFGTDAGRQARRFGRARVSVHLRAVGAAPTREEGWQKLLSRIRDPQLAWTWRAVCRFVASLP